MSTKKNSITSKVAKSLKRNFGLLTLAMTDVSKSALANQKEQGLQADQAVTQSAWSEAKHTIADMKAGRQTRQTAEMADGWWRSYIRAQRTAWIEGEYRELTDEEWRARWEVMADPSNKEKGEVVSMHRVTRSYDDQAALVHHEDGRVSYSEEKLQESMKATVHFTANEGYFKPTRSINDVLVRVDSDEQATVELHTNLVRGEVDFFLLQDEAYTHLRPSITRVAFVQEEYTGLVLRSYALEGELKVSVHRNVVVFSSAAREVLPTAEEIAIVEK